VREKESTEKRRESERESERKFERWREKRKRGGGGRKGERMFTETDRLDRLPESKASSCSCSRAVGCRGVCHLHSTYDGGGRGAAQFQS
jgi:hypothetical protein